MDNVVSFEEGARRARARRAAAALGSDWFWFTTIPFWPLSLALIATRATLDASFPGERRK